MKVTAAFATLSGAATSAYVSHHDTLPLMLVLVLVALCLAAHGAFVVLYVCRPADRKDLRKLLRAWRTR